MSAGYSGTPLIKKLGIKPGLAFYVQGEPESYWRQFGPLPEGTTRVARLTQGTAFAHVFVSSRKELAAKARKVLERMAPDGVFWVSWPKKSSGVETDITEDVIREVILPLGLVDIKVCAVDETWSGLKLMMRRELRKKG